MKTNDKKTGWHKTNTTRMRNKYWETKDGNEIAYKDLEDSHLLNIIRFIEKKAEEGITFVSGGGGWDNDDMWYDEEYLIGEEVLEHFDYKGILNEALKRDFITQKEYLLKA